MVAIVPGGFDQDAAEMRIASFGDAALPPRGAARMLRRDEADVGHQPRGRGKAPRIAEFRRNREGGEVVDAAEAPQPSHPFVQGLEIEEGAEILLDVAEASDDLVDGTEIRTMRLIEGRQRPPLC